MSEHCSFRFTHYRDALEVGIDAGYSFRTCEEYASGTAVGDLLVAVLRHDVDLSPERAVRFAEIEAQLGIRATYFFRVRANEYNLFGYEVSAILAALTEMGHELGLHSEPVDFAAASGCTPTDAFEGEVRAFELALGRKFSGVASHNDCTPDNNLDFFRAHTVDELGVGYDAYDDCALDLFAKSTYVTDGYLWFWRVFENGELTQRRECLCDVLRTGTPHVYTLTHPHAWYDEHFHRVNF